MKKNKKIIYIASIFIMFLMLFIFFPTSKVKAASVLEKIDNLNGVTDKRSSSPCSVSVSIDDLILAAQSKPNLYYSNEVAGLAGKNVSDIPEGKNYFPYDLNNDACIDAHDYSSYGNYYTAVYCITGIIDVNLDGKGTIVVHTSGGDKELSKSGTPAKYLYGAAYLASTGYNNSISGRNIIAGCVARAYYNQKVDAIPSRVAGAGQHFDDTATIDAGVAAGYLKYKGRFIVMDGIVVNGAGANVLQSQLVFAGTKATSSLKIDKVDQNRNKLKGATFIIRNKTYGYYLNSNSWLVKTKKNAAKWSTTKNGNYQTIEINDLPAGEYEAIETKAPDGYKKITKPIALTVNGTTKVVNSTQTTVTIEIYKYNTVTGEPMPGIIFNFRTVRDKSSDERYLDSNGKPTIVKKENAYDFETDENGKIVIEDLPIDRYSAFEGASKSGIYGVFTKAWRGYKEIPVNTVVEVGNTPKDIKLTIIKYDESNEEKKVAGAKFKIKEINTGKYLDSSKELVDAAQAYEFVTDANGTISLKEVPGGEYQAYETYAPEGYKIKTLKGIELEGNGTTYIPNPPEIKTIDLGILKYDNITRRPLSGATFKIKEKNTGNWLSSSKTLVSKSQAATFTTNSNGRIYLEKVPKGRYIAYEQSAPPGYRILYTNGVDLQSNGLTSIPNEQLISLAIEKYDKDQPTKKLPHAKFKIRNKDTNQYLNQYKQLVDASAAYTFETGDNGKIELSGIIRGNYEAYEIQAPPNYKIVNAQGISLTANGVTQVPNELDTITLKIHKYDSLDARISLEGVPFKIKNKDNNKWVDANSQWVDEARAATFKTDANGTITVKGVIRGNYVAYEQGNPFGYTMVNVNGTDLKADDTTEIPNTPVLVSLQGTVFLDGGEGKTNARNDVFDSGEGINGVKVSLRKNGTEIANVSSGYDNRGNYLGNGTYKFYGEDYKIRQTELSQYTIVFEYNGIKYENVAASTVTNGSKAKETTADRNIMNTRFSSLTANSKINNGRSVNNSSTGYTVEYSYNQYPSEGRYESKVVYQTREKDNKGHKFDDKYYADTKYHIKSYISETGYELENQTVTNNTIYNINFGMYERPMVDMAIKNQLYAAEVNLTRNESYYGGKTYRHLYRYNRNDNYNISIRCSNDYNKAIDRELYRSDVEYNRNNNGALKLYLTYRIDIQNQNSQINATVGDIINYYDSGLNIVGVGNSVSTDTNAGTLTIGGNVKYDNLKRYTSKYNQVNILVGTNQTIYVKYEVSQSKLLSLVNGNINIAANVVEINSCSAKKDGKDYTAIDSDSAVGNADPERRLQTVEDDLGWAPDVTLKLSSESRNVNGLVFVDYTDPEFKVGQERKGDGKLTSQDTERVEGVQVSLYDIGTRQIVRTNNTQSNGTYTLSGFIPGDYIVIYQYGTQKPVQQYQGTIYDKNRITANYEKGNGFWYKTDVDTRLSDAIDVYDGNEYYTLPQNDGSKTRKQIESTWNEGSTLQHIRHDTSIDSNLKLDAYTPKMDIQLEINGNITRDNDTGSVEFKVRNVDFGIVERARYKIKINDKVSKILLKTSEGNVLKEIVPSANMNVSNVKYMPSAGRESKTQKATKGFIEMEIDSEILQRAQLFVEYEYTLENKSELEYATKDYYRSGVAGTENDKVKLTASNIINYVDDELSYDKNNKMLTNDTTNEANKWSVLKYTDANKWLKSEVYNSLKVQRNSIYEFKYTTVLLGKGFENERLKPGESTSSSIKLLVDKSLVPTQDDMKYSNWTEVVEVTKNWGREIYSDETNTTFGETLGNFNPDKPDPNSNNKNNDQPGSNKEPDYHYSEDIIIHPPTGESGQIVMYATIGLVSLIILAVGIIVIRKKLLKTN